MAMVFTGKAVTLGQDLFPELYLELNEITAHWQKELRRWQYGVCICNCRRAQCFDIVTETNSIIYES